MGSAVLDASAILALLQGESGGNRVSALLQNPAQEVLVSTLNWSEVLVRLLRHGIPAAEAERRIARMGMGVVDFDESEVISYYTMQDAHSALGRTFASANCKYLLTLNDDTHTVDVTLRVEKRD